ncbi:hypothetical protein BSM4216_0743 [Bacillus smithii]|nr:hypothetical protein BSM4216_0743 [Bacillus smithii]
MQKANRLGKMMKTFLTRKTENEVDQACFQSIFCPTNS